MHSQHHISTTGRISNPSQWAGKEDRSFPHKRCFHQGYLGASRTTRNFGVHMHIWNPDITNIDQVAVYFFSSELFNYRLFIQNQDRLRYPRFPHLNSWCIMVHPFDHPRPARFPSAALRLGLCRHHNGTAQRCSCPREHRKPGKGLTVPTWSSTRSQYINIWYIYIYILYIYITSLYDIISN